ncbi:MAG: hypothetical protein K6E15_11785 [Prevotella sp.]|nr:hypothetical protein [Prevotella sp.]
MEKSEAIRRFNEGKHYIETCLEQIASLEQNNDKELRQVLRGTVMVEVSYKAAENFCKVGSYVIDGKDGAQKLKDKLINMKVKVLQLYDGADRINLLMIKNICDTIISEINEVEEWTGDNEQTNQETGLTVNNPIPETDDNIDVKDEDGEDEDGEDEGSDDVNDKISLPLAMDTEKARSIFTAAYDEEWMNGDNTIGYTWIGFGNISKRTGRTVSCTNKLAYLCHKIYEPSTPPWGEIGYFFNLERLDRDWSNIKDLIADVKRPSWMNTIDHLIRNKRY